MRSLILLGCAVALCAAQEVHHGQHPHQHPRTVEEWIAALENPERDGWQKPDKVLRALGLEAGSSIADIGAGSGYFSVRFARAVGPAGKVFAADIDEGLIQHVAHRAGELGLANIEPVLGVPDDPRLPDESVDLIFICDVIHHVENRAAYYPKLARALRAGGRLVIIDFYKRELPVGPGPAMKIAKDDMIREITQAGFALTEQFDFLPYQYFLVFQEDHNR